MNPLSDLDAAILNFEETAPRSIGRKEEAIRAQLDISPVRYHQRLNLLLDAPAHAQPAAPAASAPALLTTPVTDDAGVLTDSERAEIEQAIQQVSQSQGKSVRVVFLRTFGDISPSDWVDQALSLIHI